MQTTVRVAACRALTVTDTGCEQVCTSSFPESATVMMSGERPLT
jgi:hypothetical protein